MKECIDKNVHKKKLEEKSAHQIKKKNMNNRGWIEKIEEHIKECIEKYIHNKN